MLPSEHEQDVFYAVQDIFREVFARADLVVTPEMKTGDLAGWDSFRTVEILLACEQRWSLRFSSFEIDRIHTVDDLVSTIAARTRTA